MTEAKFFTVLVVTVLLVAFGGYIVSSIQPAYSTGTDVRSVHEVGQSETVALKSTVKYKLVAESCTPFSMNLDGHQFDGQPQDPKGSFCTSSYYKVEETTDAQTAKLTLGTAYISVSGEKPVSLAVTYDYQETVTEITIFVCLILWVLVAGFILSM